MHTNLEDGVLCNGQQPESVVNDAIDQGVFEAMQMLSSRIAPCCDKNFVLK